MKGAGAGRIKLVLEMIPQMIFKIDLNSRIGLREIDQQWWKTIPEMDNFIEEKVFCGSKSGWRPRHIIIDVYIVRRILQTFYKNIMSCSSNQTLLAGETVCSVMTCSWSDNHLVWILLPFSAFVLLLKCLFFIRGGHNWEQYVICEQISDM